MHLHAEHTYLAPFAIPRFTDKSIVQGEKTPSYVAARLEEKNISEGKRLVTMGSVVRIEA